MVPIAQETSVEVLRKYSLWLEAEVKRLTRELSQVRKGEDSARQQQLSEELQDQLTRLRTKFFGFGRETAPEVNPRPVGHVQQDLLAHGGRPVTGQTDSPAPLAVEPVEYLCNDEQLAEAARERGISPAAASVWEPVTGFFQSSCEVTIIERRFVKKEHRRQKYRLKKEFNSSGKEVLITAPGPVKLKPQCSYSVDFAVAAATDKYAFHLPLERQRRKMEGAGLSIDVKTLFSLCQAVAEHCEQSVLKQIREDILGDFCAVHLDESPWPLLGKGSGYMWALSNRNGSYFQFEPSRSGKIACEMLKNYQGAMLVDGFSGYKRVRELSDIRIAHCWSHARREFYERLADFPKECTEILGLIDELFALEHRGEGFKNLAQVRREHSRPLVQKIQKWLFATRPRFLPGDGLVKAIDYCLKHWSGLTLFLKDLSVPLTNNDAERALRHVVMGRKNFAGSKSIDGADVAATLYTVIESAKKASLNPSDYLKYVITERWYGRVPLSPLRLAIQKYGADTESDCPKKSDWRI